MTHVDRLLVLKTELESRVRVSAAEIAIATALVSQGEALINTAKERTRCAESLIAEIDAAVDGLMEVGTDVADDEIEW